MSRRDWGIPQTTISATLSLFVIVDSDPRSTPLELQASNYGVPIFPIIKSDSTQFGVFTACGMSAGSFDR
jgi:hypothetical protein